MNFFTQYGFWIVLGAFVLISLITLLMRWQKNRLRVFLPLFDGGDARISVLFTSKISGVVQGQPATIIFYPQDKNHPPRREVRAAYARSDAWRITPKGLAYMELSLTPKVKTNDPLWDEKFTIRSKNPEAVLYLLGDLKKKEAVEQLMRLSGVRHLSAKSGTVRLFQSHISFKDTSIEDLRTILDLMNRFSY